MEQTNEDFYLKEFELFDGEDFIKFNIVYVDFEKSEILVAVTNRGKISLITFDLMDSHNGYFFEYDCCLPNIYLEDFKEVA